MYLTHKDHTGPELIERVVPDVTADIKSFVDKGRKSYEQIVKHIRKAHAITESEIVSQIGGIKESDPNFKEKDKPLKPIKKGA